MLLMVAFRNLLDSVEQFHNYWFGDQTPLQQAIEQVEEESGEVLEAAKHIQTEGLTQDNKSHLLSEIADLEYTLAGLRRALHVSDRDYAVHLEKVRKNNDKKRRINGYYLDENLKVKFIK